MSDHADAITLRDSLLPIITMHGRPTHRNPNRVPVVALERGRVTLLLTGPYGLTKAGWPVLMSAGVTPHYALTVQSSKTMFAMSWPEGGEVILLEFVRGDWETSLLPDHEAMGGAHA